jgi:hypothetical protein
VGLIGGGEFTAYRKRKRLEQMLRRAEAHEPEVEMPDATYAVIGYHNSLVQDRGGKSMFTSLAQKADEAIGRLTSGVEDITREDGEGMWATVERVRAFERLPRPIYRTASYTPRPVSVGGNHPMQMPGDVLTAMFTTRYVYLDGSKIQLALFEKLAREIGINCSVLRAHLNEHLDGEIDLWDELGSSLDLPDRSASRQAAKRATYAALYFSGAPNLTKTLCSEYSKATRGNEWPDGDDVAGFFKHPLVKDLLSARDSMKAHLKEKGGMEDAFGIKRSTGDFSGSKNPARTLLSCVLQGHELKLMWPLYKEAIAERKRNRKDRFRIALYKYDGIVLWVREGHKEREKQKWIGELQDAFNGNAEDVLTRLDLEQDGPPES